MARIALVTSQFSCVDDAGVYFPPVARGSLPDASAGGAGGDDSRAGGAPAAARGGRDALGSGAAAGVADGGTSATGLGASSNLDPTDAGSSQPGACGPCPCSTAPFGPAELVTGLGVAGDAFGPAFSADGSTLFFSAVTTDENIYAATRVGRVAQFSGATVVPNLDAGGTEEGTPFLTFDGLSLYFFSTRPGAGVQGERDIWVALRDGPEGAFGAPTVVPAVNGEELDHLPRLSRDELALAFVSGRASPSAGSNIWMAERASREENFGPALELPGINTDAREEGFSLSPDGLTLYFASDRIVPLDMDLWVATRPDASSAFEAPEPLAQLNTNEQEIDPALSPDGSELFFASTRNGAAQIFRSVRACAP